MNYSKIFHWSSKQTHIASLSAPSSFKILFSSISFLKTSFSSSNWTTSSSFTSNWITLCCSSNNVTSASFWGLNLQQLVALLSLSIYKGSLPSTFYSIIFIENYFKLKIKWNKYNKYHFNKWNDISKSESHNIKSGIVYLL